MKRLFALLLTCALLFSGCAGGARAPQSDDLLRFTDALGREVAAEKSPRRVAALLGSFAEVWLLAGGSLCAAAEDAWEDFSLALPEAVNIGGAHSPNLELLLASNPELVIASASTASHVQLCQTLEAAGITVAYFDVDDFQDYLSMLELCTQLTGRQELYVENGLNIQKQIDAIRQTVAQSALPESRRKVLLLRASSGFVKAKGSSGTILGEMLADLGCINIADSDTSLLENLQAESILRMEPYRIFVVTMGNDTQKALENLDRLLTENPVWGGLAAVQAGRIHVMDRKLFNIKPNVRWAESYEILKDILLAEA